MHREIFLAVPLLALVWRREYPVPCCAKGCETPASHVLARLHAGETALPPGRLNANTYHRTSAWCPDHLGRALKRRNVPVVTTYEEAIRLVRAMDEAVATAADTRHRDRRLGHPDQHADDCSAGAS